MSLLQIPLPPMELPERVGGLRPEPALWGLAGGEQVLAGQTGWWDETRASRSYLRLGRALADTIRASLPQEWSFEGKRILDFGCRAGRVARHFLDEAEQAEWHACDFAGPSIDWLAQNLGQPFRPLRCGDWPPLPFEDGYFDLIYAVSVYPHLGRNWSTWLAEHQRLLAAGGLLWASFLGPIARQDPRFAGWDAEVQGIAVRANERDRGGQVAAHAPWWIRQQWGRAFEFLLLLPDGLALPAGHGQGFALMRRREMRVTPAELGIETERCSQADGGQLEPAHT